MADERAGAGAGSEVRGDPGTRDTGYAGSLDSRRERSGSVNHFCNAARRVSIEV